MKKKCGCCKKEKEFTQFCRNRTKNDGVQNRCKECNKRHREENRDKRKEYNKEYYLTHKEESRKYRLENIEKKREYDRDYHYRNRGKRLAYNISYMKRTDYARKYRLKNYDKEKQRIQEYNKKHKDKIRARDIRRRIRFYSAEGSFSETDLVYLYSLQNGLCAYCSKEITQDTYTVDHIHPLSKGGSNSIFNLVLSCGPCNCSKGSKSFYEWCNSSYFMENCSIVDSIELLYAV